MSDWCPNCGLVPLGIPTLSSIRGATYSYICERCRQKITVGRSRSLKKRADPIATGNAPATLPGSTDDQYFRNLDDQWEWDLRLGDHDWFKKKWGAPKP